MNKFIQDNWLNIFGIIIAYFSLILPIYRYLKDKRKDERNKRFENYHNLIDILVGANSNTPKLDRQIAIIYELRNFHDYFPVTLRIINGLKITWSQQDPRLLKEIDLTETYIESSWLERRRFDENK